MKTLSKDDVIKLYKGVEAKVADSLPFKVGDTVYVLRYSTYSLYRVKKQEVQEVQVNLGMYPRMIHITSLLIIQIVAMLLPLQMVISGGTSRRL